jgi:ribosome-binding factor A
VNLIVKQQGSRDPIAIFDLANGWGSLLAEVLSQRFFFGALGEDSDKVYKRVGVIMDRTDRISEEIKRELSDLIQNHIKDPRLPEFVSITSVRVTKDLRYAKVYVSVLGDEEKKKDAMAALSRAAGFVRHEIGQRINLRFTPEFSFKLDDSIEHGMYLSKLINDTIHHENEAKTADDMAAKPMDENEE